MLLELSLSSKHIVMRCRFYSFYVLQCVLQLLLHAADSKSRKGRCQKSQCSSKSMSDKLPLSPNSLFVDMQVLVELSEFVVNAQPRRKDHQKLLRNLMVLEMAMQILKKYDDKAHNARYTAALIFFTHCLVLMLIYTVEIIRLYARLVIS